MRRTEAVEEGVVTLLKALPRNVKDAIVVRIARDEEFSNDILDLATISRRRREPSRPFRDYLAARRRS